MYRIHNQTNSPYQIDTRKGVTVVPAYGSVIADLTDDQRVFLEGYPDYRVEPVSYEKMVDPPTPPRPPPKRIKIEGVPHSDERDWLVRELEELGVLFDRRLGIKKLRKLLDATNR